MFKIFNDFIYHERAFNTFFATSVSITISLCIAGVLVSLNFFSSSASWFVGLLLILVPVGVFIGVSGNKEFNIAYYKIWRDRIAAHLDQRKVYEQFVHQYLPSRKRVRPERIDVDGRWVYHFDTDYIHTLETQRNLILTAIHQEFQDALLEKEAAILEALRFLQNTHTELTVAQKLEDDAKTLLNTAHSSEEVYIQRRNHEAAIHQTAQRAMERAEAEKQLKIITENRDTLCDNYEDAAYQITKIYRKRYQNYTERVTGIIARVDKLKYEIADLPEPDSWLVKVNRKEIK